MNLRLFVALDPPDDVRRALLVVSAALRRAAGEAADRIRWVRGEQLHLTLRFLGDLPESALEGVAGAVRGAAAAGRPLALELRGAGAFPSSHRARALWLGVGGETAALGTLVADLGAWLERAGHPPEPRPFAPHLTLGRSRALRGLTGLSTALARGAAGPPLPWRAEALTLFQSHLGPGGARYQALVVAPLGTPVVPSSPGNGPASAATSRSS